MPLPLIVALSPVEFFEADIVPDLFSVAVSRAGAMPSHLNRKGSVSFSIFETSLIYFAMDVQNPNAVLFTFLILADVKDSVRVNTSAEPRENREESEE